MAERLTKKISKTIQNKYSLGSYLYKGDKMEYQKALIKQLLKMIEENEKEEKVYKSVNAKLPEWNWNNEQARERYNKIWNSLSKNEIRAYYNQGKRYSRTAIQRVRIELNKAMIEWEKGE